MAISLLAYAKADIQASRAALRAVREKRAMKKL